MITTPFGVDRDRDGEGAADLSLFDCSTAVGRPSGRQWRDNRAITPTALLAEMDRTGVSAAVVHHVLAREYSPQMGNERLMEDDSSTNRLLKAWVVLPHHTGEFPAPEIVVEEMQKAGAVMVRLHPATSPSAHRFLLADWVVGPLFEELAHANIPMALDFNLFRRAEPPWMLMHELFHKHPTLNVILTDVQGRNNRTLYPLLERHANVFVQSSGFNVHRGIEDFVARFGPERMIFGSDYPFGSMGSARYQLESASISTADKRRIGAGNLKGLLVNRRERKDEATHV